MKWIGLTGGIATGKSTVTQRLRTLGYEVLDADFVSHQVTGPGGAALPQIFAAFGDTIKTLDGGLDRKALGALVFGQPEQRLKLEAIIHPLVRAEIDKERQRLQKSGVAVAFYDVPLLFEQKLENNFDAVVVVTTTPELQLQRLMTRNSLNTSEAEARLRSQMSLAEKAKRTPYVIHNTQDLPFLEAEVDRVLRELKV